MRKRSWSTIALVLIAAVYAVVMVHWRWNGSDGEAWRHVIYSDAKGYYGYLRAVFITHDLGQEPLDTEYLHPVPEGRTLNKYFAGTSVLMAPWALFGHGWALLTDAKTDGYSAPYVKALCIGALVYALLGLLFLRRVLRGLGVRDGTIGVILMVLAFGTQFLQYAVMQPAWTHVYSFFAFTAFLATAQVLDPERPGPRLLLAGALFGLVVLVRPVNGILLFAMPLIWGNTTFDTLRSMLRKPLWCVSAVLVALTVFAIQSVLWYVQTGNLWEWGYRGEGFYWTDPAILDVLFGWRRGLFVYTPVMFLAFLAALVLWRSDRWRAGGALIYWAITTYVISAWWIWYYGGGFGHRAYVEHYAVLILPLAIVLDRIGLPLRRVTIGALGLLSILHLLQLVQFHRNILHPEHMDRAMYSSVFIRFGEEHRFSLGGNNEARPYHPNGLSLVVHDSTDLDRPGRYWVGGERVTLADQPDHGSVCKLSDASEYSTSFAPGPDELPIGQALHLEIGLVRYAPQERASQGALAVFAVESRSGFRYYKTSRMDPMPARAGMWEPIQYNTPLPALEPGDVVRFYIWNKELEEFLLDDLSIKVYAVDPY